MVKVHILSRYLQATPQLRITRTALSILPSFPNDPPPPPSPSQISPPHLPSYRGIHFPKLFPRPRFPQHLTQLLPLPNSPKVKVVEALHSQLPAQGSSTHATTRPTPLLRTHLAPTSHPLPLLSQLALSLPLPPTSPLAPSLLIVGTLSG